MSDYQRETNITDQQWMERFASHMIDRVKRHCVAESDGENWTLPELEDYARRQAAPAYLPSRKEYIDPEEAADTDISYWE